MRRLIILLVALGFVAAACGSGTTAPEGQPGAVAQVNGAPGAVTHGDDPLPAKPPALFAQAPPEAAWPCEGDGTDGRRVQFLYLHGPGSFNLESLRPTFEAWARQIEGMFLTSARETGGERLVRFVTDPSCGLSIVERQVSPNSLASFDAMITELRAAGLTDDRRSYHAWVESNAYCGIGTVYTDDRPSGNLNDANAQYSRTDRPCWNANVAAHELVHNFGGVQNSAPNSTGGLHCRDEADVMCYADGAPKGQMVQVCPPVGEDRLDCGKDDYFSTAPSGYLASHWNVADSSSLSRSTASTTSTTTPPPTTSTTLPPTTSTSIGRGATTTELVLPPTVRVGEPFRAVAYVSGKCAPTGVVEFYASGQLMSRQVLGSDASVVLTFSEPGRFTVRATYVGSDRCAKSQDSARKRVS